MNDAASSTFVLEHLEDAFKLDKLPPCELSPSFHKRFGHEVHIYLYSRLCPDCGDRLPVVMCHGCRNKVFTSKIKHRLCPNSQWHPAHEVMTLVEVLK